MSGIIKDKSEIDASVYEGLKNLFFLKEILTKI